MEDFLSIIVGGGDLPNLVLKCCDTILVYFSFQQIYSKLKSILNENFYFNAFAFSQDFFLKDSLQYILCYNVRKN